MADSASVRKKIPILCGPTASGKTAVAMQLAEKFPIEIISADSRQVYRQLDIGTGKPTAGELALVPTHLINLIEPGERYNAARFVREARQIISEIFARGKQPLIVGGTGLYLKALTAGLIELDDFDMSIREQLEGELISRGADALWEELYRRDPLDASKIHPNNQYRLLRSLEILRSTGQTKTELMRTRQDAGDTFEFNFVIMNPLRDDLYRSVNERVLAMITNGWMDEVSRLVRSGIADSVRKSSVIGYSELIDVSDGRLKLSEAIVLIQQQTRQYAKRQQTWFRHQTVGTMAPDPKSALAALENAIP